MSRARGEAGEAVEHRPERERSTAATRGRVSRALRLAAAVASALVHLLVYRAPALVWGDSPSRALVFLPHWSARTRGRPGGERLPGPFHPGLFRLLHRLAVPVVPVTIRYGDRRAYWTDETPLVSHLWTGVLAGESLPAAVHLGAALDPRAESDGESLARAAYRAVSRPIEDLGELSDGRAA